MSFGMTNTGFKPKRFADVLDSLTNRIRSISNPDTGEYPFVNETADGLLLQVTSVIAEEIAICWEQAYLASVQFDPQNASGVALRGLVQINAINPSYGTPTQLPIVVRGTAGTVIPAGSRISLTDGAQIYEVQESVVIPASGEATANTLCTEVGANNPAPGTIIQIQTPIFGWNYASNASATSIGTNADTDTQLHIKQARATSATSYRQVDAIIAGIMTVPGVTYARLYVNKTLTTDARGIAGKTMAAVVVGGLDTDIANVLRLKAGSLDNFAGNLSEPIEYVGELGDVETIDFYRPTEVPIYISIGITVTESGVFPEDAVDQIKQAIVDYAVYDQEGVAGFPPGADVLVSRLYTPINSVPGFKVDSLQIGTSSEGLSTSDITIAWNELATFDASRITITTD
jgi:uncharacterized phage protein gp47/JayE